MYFTEDEVRRFFTNIANSFPGSSMLAEFLTPFLVRKESIHDSLKKMGKPIAFKWGPRSSREPAQKNRSAGSLLVLQA